MLYKTIIKEAWGLSKKPKNPYLRIGLFPAFFQVLMGIVYIIYQIYTFYYSPLFGNGEEERAQYYYQTIIQIGDWMASHEGLSFFIVGFGIFSIVMFLFSPLVSEILLTNMVVKNTLKTKRSIFSFSNFGTVLKFYAILGIFSTTSFIHESIIFLKNFGIGTWLLVLPVLIFLLFFGLLLNFIFIFTPHYIILENYGLVDALRRSSNLVIRNFRDNFLIWILMFFVMTRVLISFLIILFIPIVISLIFQLFSAIPWLGIVLGIGIGLGLLAGIIYFLARFSVFITMVWTLTFMELRKKEIEE